MPLAHIARPRQRLFAHRRSSRELPVNAMRPVRWALPIRNVVAFAPPKSCLYGAFWAAAAPHTRQTQLRPLQIIQQSQINPTQIVTSTSVRARHPQRPSQAGHGPLARQRNQSSAPAHLVVQPIKIDRNTPDSREAHPHRIFRVLSAVFRTRQHQAEFREPRCMCLRACRHQSLAARPIVKEAQHSVGASLGHRDNNQL